jgi:hypothetical protein
MHGPSTVAHLLFCHVGQAHLAGSALKKGVKPAKRRELVRQVRQAYQLSESRACGLMRITRWSNRYQSRRDPPERATHPAAGFGRHADPIRLSKTDSDVAARRLAGKYQTRLPAVSGRGTAGAREEASHECRSSADHASRSHFCEPTLEHGLCEPTAGGWTMVSNSDDHRSIHPRVSVPLCRHHSSTAILRLQYALQLKPLL